MKILARLLAALIAFAPEVQAAGVQPNTGGVFAPGVTGRSQIGAAAGNGINLLDPKYGADNTGVANNDTALQNAVNDACNNASPATQAKEVFIPDGIYAFSPVALITITNACWIHGSHPLLGGTQGGAVLRVGVGIATDFFQCRALGQCKFTDFRLDMSGGQQVGGASYCRVHTGWDGVHAYAVNDTITLGGGTSSSSAILRVTAVSAGAVTGCVISVAGNYSAAPSPVSPVTQGATSGTGQGATFDMIFAAAAGISLSGPATTLTANAANTATVLTVASCTGFAAGGAVEVEQDDGNYKVTTQSGACTGNTLTLAAGLTFAAASGHIVYAKATQNPLIDNVSIVNFWDGIRIDNAAFVTVRNTYIQDYSHDGIIKINAASPISGGDHYQGQFLDLNLGTSSAGIEFIAGGDVGVAPKSKFLGSNFSVLLNTYFVLTGTLEITGSSLEESNACAVKLHQSIAAKEYHNIVIVGNEFSSLATNGQHFCVDVGTANTSPKWINLINFSHNSSNSAVASGVNMVQVLDGDIVVIAGNTLYNNGTAGPNAIAVGGAATNVLEFGNTIAGYPSGNYGTMNAGSFANFNTFSSAKLNGPINQFGLGTGAPAHIATGQTTAPVLTSCGTGSPAISGTDTAGTVTAGTAAPGCIITFNVAYTGVPYCTVTWRGTPLLSQSYVVSNTAITLTQTSTSGDVIDYHCIARSGG